MRDQASGRESREPPPEALWLSASLLHAVMDHVRDALPEEAVGLLGGPAPHHATLRIPLPNRAGRRAFLADPRAQFQAERELSSRGYHLVAIYHSHPRGVARLSPTDIAFARRRSCVQLVIALDRPCEPREEVRAYRLIDGVAREVRIELASESADDPAL